MALLFLSGIMTILSCCTQLCYSEIIECSKPPPGVSQMVRGVDITELDLVPLDINYFGGVKSPIVNFTCNEERTWRSPAGDSYQLPDQIWHMTSTPGGWLSADVNLYKTHKDVRRTMAREVGGEGEIWKFAFSASHSYKKMENTITNSSRFVADISAFDSATRVDFIPSWVIRMDRFAQMFVDRMISGNFSTNPIAYNRFIQEFGTHYFSSANFGGFIRVLHEIKKDYFYSTSESNVKTNAKASFLSFIKANGGRVTSSTTVDERFRSATTTSVKYYGGDTNLLTQNGIQQWQPTVDADPWLFSGMLKPISDLISDETKRSSMVQAVSNHVMQSYLDDLQRLLEAAKVVSNAAILNTLKSRLDTLKTQKLLDENQVEQLGQEVEEQIIVPDWFRTRTQLCYKWRPDGDGGQCGGGAARLLCAKPNSMTPVYRDDTDRRSGGCRMQWGIQSSGFPAWFQQVRICYRWHPDGDGGQCGGGAARMLCSSINGYSPEYRDDTDRRSGGCQMSWRIEVPTSAPVWMQTAKMCFSWYPDGDGGQCGPAPSRNMCATANQWTGYYRDDTDRRSGGCRLSWGLKLAL